MRHTHTRDLGLRPGLPAFLLGFLAAAFQIYLMREFSAGFSGNELVFGLFLGSWLLWGGLGSLARPAAPARVSPGRLTGLYAAVILLFFAALVALRFSHRLLGILPTELTGLGPALGFALGLSLLLSFPLGHAFVLNAGLLGGDVARVYLLESAGAATAGLFVQLALIPRFSNWRGAAIVGASAAFLGFAAGGQGRHRRALAGVVILALALAGLDLPTEKMAFEPMRLVDAKDSPYGKLLVVRTAEQVTLYDNGQPVFSYPDTGAAEDSVHFALLQRDTPRRIALIGGGASGGVAEALKYPETRVDYVELDPAVIRLAEEHLAPADSAPLKDRRVSVFYRDGRTWLERSAGGFDAILLNLPVPATAQVNRYYTQEFFAAARAKLAPGGVFGFIVPSAENYISEDQARLLASYTATLRSVFKEVVAVPGATCVFLASDLPLTIDPDRLSEAIVRLGLKNRFVSPEMLPSRLNALRVASLAGRIAIPGARINRDLVPVCYYFQAVLWAAQFRGFEARLVRAASRVPRFWVLDAPLVAFAVGLALLGARKGRTSARFLVPVGVMGFTSIVVEFVVLVAFQARFGSVYGELSLLLASFMAGLVLGSFLARRRNKPGRADLAAAQGGLVAALLASLGGLTGRGGGEALPFILLFAFGGLGGYLFVAANRQLLRERAHQGLGYGMDLLASFAGVLLASTVVIPLWGVPAVLVRLTVLNALALAYILAPASPS